LAPAPPAGGGSAGTGDAAAPGTADAAGRSSGLTTAAAYDSLADTSVCEMPNRSSSTATARPRPGTSGTKSART
jgi:hypothetical protein